MDFPQQPENHQDVANERENAAPTGSPQPPPPPQAPPISNEETFISNLSAFLSQARGRLPGWLRDRSNRGIFATSLRILNTCLLLAIVYFLYVYLVPFVKDNRGNTSDSGNSSLSELNAKLDNLGELTAALSRHNENLESTISTLREVRSAPDQMPAFDTLSKEIARLTKQLESIESAVSGLQSIATSDSPRYKQVLTQILTAATDLDTRVGEIQDSIKKTNDSAASALKVDIARFESKVVECDSSIASCRDRIDQLSQMLSDKVDMLVEQRLYPPQDVLLVAMHTPELSAESYWSIYRSIFSRPLAGESTDSGPRVTFAVGSTGELSILREPGTTLPTSPPIVITKATENPRALAAAIKADYIDMLPLEDLEQRRQRCILVASENCVSLGDIDLKRWEDFARVDIVLIKNDPSSRGDSIVEWDLWITRHPRWNVHLVRLEDAAGFGKLLTDLLGPLPFPNDLKGSSASGG